MNKWIHSASAEDTAKEDQYFPKEVKTLSYFIVNNLKVKLPFNLTLQLLAG